MDRQTELQWLRCATAVAAVACKNTHWNQNCLAFFQARSIRCVIFWFKKSSLFFGWLQTWHSSNTFLKVYLQL